MPPTLTVSQIKPTDLPSPPQSALEMLRACSRDDVDSRHMAEFAATDPVLTAEVLRVVNTPLFGIAHEVASVRHAISLLGVRALRNIVLCLMVRKVVSEHAIPGLELTLFWEDTLRRAVSARWLGVQLGLDADECFTAGILQDFGLLILFYLHPECAGEFTQLRTLDPIQRCQSEQGLFGMQHDAVFVLLAQQWSIPPYLSEAIAAHHNQSEGSPSLSQVLFASDWINAVFCAADVNALLDKTRGILSARFGLSTEAIEQQFTALPDAVTQCAHALGLDIQAQIDFEQLMRQANTRLAKENSAYQELTWKLEKAIAERDKLAAELNREIAIAQEVQRHLMPMASAGKFPIHGVNVPARNISGDFFDYQRLRDGSICFALGDVSGKGINAGLLMAKTASLFHCLAKHIQDPARLLAMINNEICETTVRGFFVTMIAGIYQPQRREARLVNAGHLPALLLGRDSQQLWQAYEPPLGIMPNLEYSLSEPIALDDATLYLYTDGVTEAKTANGAMLEREGLVSLLRTHQGKPPTQRLQAVIEAIRPTDQLRDDITLLMIGED